MVKLIHNRFNSTTHLSSVLGGLAFLKATPRYFSTCRSLALPLPSSAEVNSDNTSLPTSSEVNHSENLPLPTSAEVNDSENLPLPTSAEEDDSENLPLPTSAEEDERDNSPSSSEPEENNGNNSPPNSESESLNGSGSSGESGYGSDPDGEYYDEGADAMVYAPVENIPERNIREYITATKDISQHPIEVDNHRDDSDSAEGRQVYYDRHFELKAELRLRKTQGVVVDSDSDDDGSCATCHTPLHAGPDVPSNKPRGEVANTEVANTDVANTDVANTEVANTEVANTDVANTEVANTEVANTDVANTDAIIGTPAVDTLALRNKSEADDQSSAQSNSTSNKRKFEADEDSSSQRRPGYQDSSDITADTEPMSYGWDAED
uniref:Cytochrome c domain-containing protein n=1 Tax=Rhynchosporium secalis TaxID=38038 RepID=V5W5R6_RHYSE|nr:hypothetical protein [Rhynchosporium secalis]AHC02419.1 hypothetical protein [Rhynchosporium secalis]